MECSFWIFNKWQRKKELPIFQLFGMKQNFLGFPFHYHSCLTSKMLKWLNMKPWSRSSRKLFGQKCFWNEFSALVVISVLLVSDEMCYNQPVKLSTEEGLLWCFKGIFFQNCDVAAYPLTAHFLRDTKQEPNPGKKKSLRSLPLLWTLSMFKHRQHSYLQSGLNWTLPQRH